MKKPQKKEVTQDSLKLNIQLNNMNMGYNQAIDDINEWLPDEEEIFELVYDQIIKDSCKDMSFIIMKPNMIAKALAKRLGKDKIINDTRI